MPEIVGQEELPHPLCQPEGVRGHRPGQAIAGGEGQPRGDGVLVPGEHQPPGGAEPMVQADIFFCAVVIGFEGVLVDINLSFPVPFQKPQHAAAVVVVPVGEDGEIRRFQLHPQLRRIVRKDAALACIEEESGPVRLHEEAQTVLRDQFGGEGGIFE